VRVVGHYILDFYCSKIKLDIEIDGLQHLSIVESEHDAIRTGKLNQLGITVVRFMNDQINNDFDNVCMQIDSIINQKLYH
jgi:very-short-patch-repair endonuclease